MEEAEQAEKDLAEKAHNSEKMEVTNNSFALRKKHELLGSFNKRKMSLRKCMDNLKQKECQVDISQITKCVFLGSLCLKPVPQLFDSPSVVRELGTKAPNTENAASAAPQNVSNGVEGAPILTENGTGQESRETETETVKKKSPNTSRIRKKSLREKNEPKNNMYNNVKNENPISIKLEITENSPLEDVSPPITDFEQHNERIKKEPTPELIISDDETIDQLMYNIMDIKIGSSVFAKDFFEMSSSDIDETYHKLSGEYSDQLERPYDVLENDVGPPAKEKKYPKRGPQCKICSQEFSSYIKLKIHKTTHDGEKPYPCLKCGENHTTLEQLIAHLRTHQGKRPYVCKKCNKGFKTTKALEKHHPVHVLKKVVPPKKIFRCDVCLKEFRKLCDLDRHTRVHTGEKPSVCNICNRRFQQQHNLNKHLLIHTKEKPFQCDICDKRFGRSDVLNRHLLTHSIKKPNHCGICMKSFIRISQLIAHNEKYHFEKSEQSS